MATLALQQAAVDALEQSFALPTYRIDTKTSAPDKFVNLTTTDWSQVTWKDIGRPFEVKNYSSERLQWEADHHETMPVQTQWEFFNRHFHDLFITDNLEARAKARQALFKAMGRLNIAEAVEAFTDLIQLAIWNRIHRVEDAVWDPRGKRALFEGMDVQKPNILFLGAADGYEAMQLMAMYPGGHAVLVDYDDFCRTDRFGKFPESYPFLGQDPSTGHYKTYRRADMDIDFDVADIRDLQYGKEFDIVISVGLIEHFPDEHKPHAIEFHRRFLKPGGYAIVTTPRLQFQSKLYYRIMGELVNFGYRELMTAHQMGLYLYENGFDILRCGVIKAHNGIIAKVR